MPGKTSFAYAIFKRFQGAYVAGIGTTDGGHFDDANPMGGFCLLYPHHPHGILKVLGNNAPPGLAGQTPLGATNVPTDSPLYNMLAPSFKPPNMVPAEISFAGKTWPVMPPPEPPGQPLATQFDALWLEFNNGNPPPLLTAFGTWIANGKPNDSPQNGPLAQPGVHDNPPPTFPGAATALLFVASFAKDDGRRFGDGEMQGVPLDHVPANFWATSQIFLYDETGLHQLPSFLNAGAEYYVSALIGNSCGTQPAGRAFFSTNPVNVLCDAQCFNTFMSPGVPLPSLGNYDPADPNPTFEQHFMGKQSYEVAAFRLDVGKVFSALAAGLQGVNLGGMTPAEWLKAGHPCVKVRVTSGEQPNFFPPMGNVPLTLDSNPRYDRHIAQRNLAPFNTALMAIKKPLWINFIVAQAARGSNGLRLQHPGWPTNAVRFHLAIPRAPFERYVAPAGHRGFELVREGLARPFPDAVILRQTTPGAGLVVADHDSGDGRRHGPDRFFGMALGIEADPARLRGHRLGNIEMVHTAHDRAGRQEIVGGFTLQPMATRS
ncbi:MAG: hypothetical protein J0J01_30815 [Reyranella sp.]|uniref:hypothetical protein n=1 Tax=Reyranella sp. TaxID=1929291 RepID=UPI001AC81BAC|nr:hypothetical protein [Reyranella sp.]MBN9091331.1 hypothetical protein [Reyranella sp.]